MNTESTKIKGENQKNSVDQLTPKWDLFAYSTGECANSLVMGSVFAFAMLFYTEAMGLDYKLAGFAMFIVMLWDAVSDPIMGHISDSTRSRFGRRHPYMLIGGIMMVISFYLIWNVPDMFRKENLLFWYLLTINLFMRTAYTVYNVSYLAFGFEICTDYYQRTTIQAYRGVLNQIANFFGPALAWVIFFPDTTEAEATTIPANYVHMGTAFSLGIAFIVLFLLFGTQKYIIDTRSRKDLVGSSIRDFFVDMKDIILDKYPRRVFIFSGIVFIAVALIGSLQIYVYVHFMKFSSLQKAIVHGSGVAGCGLGSLLSSFLVRKFDKKGAVVFAALLGMFCSLMLFAIFIMWSMPTMLSWTMPENIPFWGGFTFPISMFIYLIFQSLFWAGIGILAPIGYSMMADVSEICKYRTGILKDGGYCAMLSFVIKAAASLGLFISGFCLSWSGFEPGAVEQTPQAIRNLVTVTFIGGAIVSFAALISILKYPITRAYMLKIKTELLAKELKSNNKKSS